MQRHWLKILVCASVAGAATGCAPILPPAVMIASQALDGISYITTGKSGTDHILSAALEEDCAIHRVVTGGAVCQPETDGDVAAASLSEDPAVDDDPQFAEESEPGTAANDSSTAPRPGGESILPDMPAPSSDEVGDENLARVPVPGTNDPSDSTVPPTAPGNGLADDESAALPASSSPAGSVA
jgi:hypothetical protein